MRLYVGGHQWSIQGERDTLGGYRCFTAAHPPQFAAYPADVHALLDSGAFSDKPERRLTPPGALDRQLDWELRASNRWGVDWQAEAIVSYDLLIDETWIGEERHKRRWSIVQAGSAVSETIAAAHYLASQRAVLQPRTLVLSAQGVDAIQYAECVDEILKVAQADDWIGLGGWCILGRYTTLLPEFLRTLYLILPRIAAAGVQHVHIFGVLYLPALGGLQWLSDLYGLTVSTDSTAPIMACTRRDKRKSGARCDYWRDNVSWWQETLETLRTSEYYCQPPRLLVSRQPGLFDSC